MFGKTEQNKIMQNAFVSQYSFVLHLAQCDLLQLAPKNKIVRKLKIWKFDLHKYPARNGLNAKKQNELTFYNIYKHVVKSNRGSSVPGAGLLCAYPISFLLKQSCDN